MKTFKKPLAAMIAALVLSGLFSFLTPPAEAASYIKEGNWRYYRNEDGGVTVDRYYGKDPNVIVPAETEWGLKVTEMSVTFFYFGFDSSFLKSVTIPASVTAIHSGTFTACENLKTVKFQPDSQLKLIEDQAFGKCYKLVNFEMPKTVTQIHGGAFRECKKLKSITIPSGVTYIDVYTFTGCTSLETVNLSNNIKHIGAAAFEACKSLKSIKLPTKLERIGSTSGVIGAFEGCSSLTSIKIPAKVKTMNASTFGLCKSLKKITVDPKNKYFTAQNGVLFNKKMTKLTIPSSVTKFEEDAVNFISDKCVLQVKANSKAHQYAKTWGLKYKLI